MKLEECYTIGELLQLNEESARNEFKPKFGNGAKRSSSDNDKAVKDIIKNASSLEKGIENKKEPATPRVEFPDNNKTTLDVNFEYDPGKDWKDRVEAQVNGYPSVQNKKENDYDKALDFDGNKKFYDIRKKQSEKQNDLNTIERESGLKARIKKDEIDYSDKTAFNESKQIKRLNEDYEHKLQHAGDVLDYYANLTHDTGHKLSSDQINQIKNLLMWLEETNANDNQVQDEYINLAKQLISDNSFNESKKIKRLKFKNTTFLSEKHLLSKVPEDYRVDENKFYMQDKTGTDYLVECKADPFGYVHMEVINKFNKQALTEEFEKIKKLSGYKYSDDNKKVNAKELEDMSETISNFRQLLK